MAINKTTTQPDTPPFAINETTPVSKVNDLFIQLFKDKANKRTKIYNGVSKADLLPNISGGLKQESLCLEGELFINFVNGKPNLCIRIENKIYKLEVSEWL
jgi:hypothetical protein